MPTNTSTFNVMFAQKDKAIIFVHPYAMNDTICNYVKLQEESDLPYEEEILRHPYQVKCWIRYIDHKLSAPKAVINLIYERALKQLPGR